MDSIAWPEDGCSVDELLRFAGTYNGYERLGRSPEALHRIVEPVLDELRTGADECSDDFGVDLLRGALFYLYRQTHHWGDVPAREEQMMRSLVVTIRDRAGELAMVDDTPR